MGVRFFEVCGCPRWRSWRIAPIPLTRRGVFSQMRKAVSSPLDRPFATTSPTGRSTLSRCGSRSVVSIHPPRAGDGWILEARVFRHPRCSGSLSNASREVPGISGERGPFPEAFPEIRNLKFEISNGTLGGKFEIRNPKFAMGRRVEIPNSEFRIPNSPSYTLPWIAALRRSAIVA